MPVVDAFVLVVGAGVLGVLVVGELVVVVGVEFDVVDLLVELALELEVDWGGGVEDDVLVPLGCGWLVIVCELVRAAVEWPAVELEVPPEPPPLSATATAPPSRTAATTNTVIQKPVVLFFSGGGGGTVACARFAGGFPSGGPVASIGTVAGVGAIAAAIAIVVSASPPPSRSAGAGPSRSRTSEAVCGRSLGDLASICMTSSPSAGGIPGLRSRAGVGSTRTCWCSTAADTSAMNGGSPVSISYSTHPSE